MKYIDENAFKPILENPIILDFSNCKYLITFHDILKDKFGLPEYYGKNWDALYDCLDCLFYKRGDFSAEIYGFFSMPGDMQEYCSTLFDIFEKVHQKTPNFTYTIVS